MGDPECPLDLASEMGTQDLATEMGTQVGAVEFCSMIIIYIYIYIYIMLGDQGTFGANIFAHLINLDLVVKPLICSD